VRTTATRLDDDRAQLEVEVPPERLAHDLQHTLRHLAESVRIPGFRKGKVPPPVVLQRLGWDEVMAETVSHHLGDWYAAAMSSTALHPVDRPEISYDALPAEGEAFAFSAVVKLRPRGRLPEPLVLEAPRAEAEPVDELVEAELELLRMEGSPLREVADRGVEEGDYVELEVRANVGGEDVPGLSASAYLAQVGDDRLLDPLDGALRGRSAGEHVQVTVDIPEDYQNARLAGKQALVDADLLAIRERDPLPLDDALAARVSEFDTLAELRADIERTLREAAEREIEGRYRAAVLEALGRVVVVDLPETLVEERTRELLMSVGRAMERRGIPFSAYVGSRPGGVAEMLAELRPEAVDMLRRDIAVEALADREGIQVDDETLAEALREAAAEDGADDVDELVQEVMTSDAKESAREELRQRLALDRAVQLATPISLEQAEARERLWTPEKDQEETPKPTLWTPGQPRDG
jgi:trigger factor